MGFVGFAEGDGGAAILDGLDNAGKEEDMARREEEYDWFNDPFDDKKNAEELKRAKGSKSVGCIAAAVLVLCVLFIVGAIVALSLSAA